MKTRKKRRKYPTGKYQTGGELAIATPGIAPTPVPGDPNITVDQWNALKKKYAGNLPKIGSQGALDKRMEWVEWANKKLPTSGTPAELAAKASKATGLNNPGLLLASSMEEGVGNRFKGDDAYSGAYDAANTKGELKNFPVDAFKSYGLDQIGGRVDEFIKKGYLPKDFKNKMKPFLASNENDEQAYYTQAAKIAKDNKLVGKDFEYADDDTTYDKLDAALKGYKGKLPTMKQSANTAAFVDDESAFMAKGAFMRAEKDNIDNYAKQKGYKLTPEEQSFFTLASYNGGPGKGQDMLDYYADKKLLGNNSFLKNKDSATGQIYDNILPRYAGANLFNKEKGFFEYGGKITNKPKYQDGGEIDPITGLPVNPNLNAAKNVGIDVFNNAKTSVPAINPNATTDQQIFRVNEKGDVVNNNAPIVPLSQFYDQSTDAFGNKRLTGTGEYTSDQGQVNTLSDQQITNDRLSADNLATAEANYKTKDNAEWASALGITAINSYFNKKNQGKQDRTNLRDAIMNKQFGPTFNPYAEGTGSQAIMKKGGKIQKGYHRMPDGSLMSNKKMKYEVGGEIDGSMEGIEILDGGKSKIISASNHSNPMMEFTGKEHSEGGIGVAYGGKIAEVENKEIGWVDGEGSLNIFGKLKLPGTNQTFKKTAKDLAEVEDKVDGMKSKYLNILNNGDPTDKYQETAHSTAKVMFRSLDKQSKEIAEKKEGLASFQNLILSMTKSDSNKMDYGGRIQYQNGGHIGPDDPIVKAILKSDFNKDGRDLSKVKSVILHKTAGDSTAKNIVSGWNSDNRNASADYIIDKDGTITQVGELKDTKWGSGRRDVNRTALNIEIVGKSADESDMTDAQYKALARLHKDVFAPMGISPNNYFGHTQVNKSKGFDFAKSDSIKNVLSKAGISNNYVANTDTFSNMDKSSNNTATGTAQTSGDDFVPQYTPIDNPDKTIDTKYGAANRNPTDFPDKVNLGVGDRKRGFLSPLALSQIAPELLTMATNRRDPVTQLSYQPELKQTFDISYQLGRNENQSTFNQAAKIAESTGNMDALSQLAAQKYKADETYNMQEIQGNAQQRLSVYGQNVDTLNDARLKNLALIADQQVKQAQAKFNTRKEDISAFTSISGKVLQNQLENRTYNAYANLFKNYGFDKKGNVTFDPDNVTQKFNEGEAQQFGIMAAQQGANAIMSGDFSRSWNRKKNDDGSTTTTETLGKNKKVQEDYKTLKAQGFDDNMIGNMLKAKYPETINQD